MRGAVWRRSRGKAKAMSLFIAISNRLELDVVGNIVYADKNTNSETMEWQQSTRRMMQSIEYFAEGDIALRAWYFRRERVARLYMRRWRGFIEPTARDNGLIL